MESPREGRSMSIFAAANAGGGDGDSDRAKALQLIEARRLCQRGNRASGEPTRQSRGDLETAASAGSFEQRASVVGYQVRNTEELVADLQAQVVGLENELVDMQRKLRESEERRNVLEARNRDLQAVVADLTANHPSVDSSKPQKMPPAFNLRGKLNMKDSPGRDISPTTSPSETDLNDRARTTMLEIRMERTQMRMQSAQDGFRKKWDSIKGDIAKVRAGLDIVRGDVYEQLDRLRAVLHLNMSAFVNIAQGKPEQPFDEEDGSLDKPVRAKRASHAVMPNEYLQLVTQAVQHQQKSMVLSHDHPLVGRMNSLFDMLDCIARQLTKQMGEMPFYRTNAPMLVPPRRFVDPVINLNSYTNLCNNINDISRHTTLMYRFLVGMEMPNVERIGAEAVAEMDKEMKERLALLFESMRGLRTAVVVRTQNLSTAMRVLKGIDALGSRGEAIVSEYNARARAHTRTCFLHVNDLLTLAKKFGNCKIPMTGPDMASVVEVAMMQNKVKHPLAPVGTCMTCCAPALCRDCEQVDTFVGTQRKLLLDRRSRVEVFTQSRITHSKKLTDLINQALHLLQTLKLVPIVQPKPKDLNVNEIFSESAPCTSSTNYFAQLRKRRKQRDEEITGGMLLQRAGATGVDTTRPGDVPMLQRLAGGGGLTLPPHLPQALNPMIGYLPMRPVKPQTAPAAGPGATAGDPQIEGSNPRWRRGVTAPETATQASTSTQNSPSKSEKASSDPKPSQGTLVVVPEAEADPQAMQPQTPPSSNCPPSIRIPRPTYLHQAPPRTAEPQTAREPAAIVPPGRPRGTSQSQALMFGTSLGRMHAAMESLNASNYNYTAPPRAVAAAARHQVRQELARSHDDAMREAVKIRSQSQPSRGGARVHM